jgi:hypothetical protein
VKKSPEEQKHFTQRRKGPEGAKKTRQFFFACLCVLAPWRELFDFFTRSKPWGRTLTPSAAADTPLPPEREGSPTHGLRRGLHSFGLTYSTNF